MTLPPTVPPFLIIAAALLSHRAPDTSTIWIAATTDVHGRAMAWDYERDRAAPLGLVRAATVIDSLRRAHPGHVILVDAGDLIEGNAFAAYYAHAPARVHPMIDALNRMGYDAAVLGNHEFNFGMPVLERALAGAHFPVISANIVTLSGPRLVRPSIMITRAGVKIGIIGATTPGVLVWDGPNIKGRLTFRPLAEAIPPVTHSVRRAGADVTLLVAHAGLSGTSSYDESAAPPEDDIARTLAASDVDVAVIGHTHREIADSMVGRTLVVQPLFLAQSVAVVELTMVRNGAHWRIVRKEGRLLPLAHEAPDSALVAALQPAHDSARAAIMRPLGTSVDAMPLTRARVEDTPVIDFVNAVMRQRSGAQLSAAAAFNTSGGIPAGPVTLASLASVYPYDNTLRAVRISGAELRAYLEFDARYWRGMGPGGPVVNDSVRGYNWDLVSGVDYEIDPAQPLGHRVTSLAYQGRDVRDSDTFTLALNNYRQQGGGGFTMLSHAPVVYDREESIRDLLADEITRQGTIRAGDYFVQSWRLRGATPGAESGGRTGTGAGGRISRDSILLRVLATNDFHGAMEASVQPWSNRRPVGGAAALAGMMNRYAAECGCATIRLDAGDVMQGTPASNLVFGRSMVDIYNAMGYDAVAVGNHEFDWSIDTLAARISQAHFAWLSSNTIEMPSRARPRWTSPSRIITAGRFTIGVVGYTTPGTTTSTNPNNVRTLGFDGWVAVDSAIMNVRAQHPDFVIVVAHEGAFCNADTGCRGEIVDLANSLTHKPDLIVSGHTHSLVNTVVNGIPIVQARSHGTALGIVDFMAADSGRVPHARVETVWADREQPDTAVARLVAAAVAQVRPLTERHVADIAQDLRCDSLCPLGELVAEAMRVAAHADVGLANNTGIRSRLTAGPVNWGEAYEVLPFGNFVVKMAVTGAVLRQVLEHALTGNEVRSSVSGITVTYDPAAPSGSRVLSVVMADGQPLRESATYQLATFDFLAAGGSGFSMLRGQPFTGIGEDELEVFDNYLAGLPQPVRIPQPYIPHITKVSR
ncbi:MAG TPA: 5'-nucleotidase C-terminal domain-containing protein [Gemmatimonadales bacterium]|jgi:2',3'-cyclic-nucleotide 2'-phosphodiesterase (5'-nucleotidase family)